MTFLNWFKDLFRKVRDPYELESLPTQPTHISSNGIEMIKQFEGFRPTVYNDVTGHETIGFGHLVKPGETFPIPLSEMRATLLMMDDMHEHEMGLREHVRVRLTQYQYDALCSLSYNIGADAFKRSSLLRALNSGDYTSAANHFDSWKYSNGIELDGLIKRRAAEKRLFLKGVYPGGTHVTT